MNEQISGAWFALLIAGFYLNDFVFIVWSGTSTLYFADYIIRLVIIGLCLSTSISREVAFGNISTSRISVWLIIPLIPILIVVSRSAHVFIEPIVIGAIGDTALFYFGRIDSSTLYIFDMTIGLALVALSEELVFRKFALNWLRAKGLNAAMIIVVSAMFFALMHWGSGLHRIAATFVFGIVAMAVYLKHTRLWPLLIVHYLSNFIAFAEFD